MKYSHIWDLPWKKWVWYCLRSLICNLYKYSSKIHVRQCNYCSKRQNTVEFYVNTITNRSLQLTKVNYVFFSRRRIKLGWSLVSWNKLKKKFPLNIVNNLKKDLVWWFKWMNMKLSILQKFVINYVKSASMVENPWYRKSPKMFFFFLSVSLDLVFDTEKSQVKTIETKSVEVECLIPVSFSLFLLVEPEFCLCIKMC